MRNALEDKLAKFFKNAKKPSTVPSTSQDSATQDVTNTNLNVTSETFKRNTLSTGKQASSINDASYSQRTQTKGSSSTAEPTNTQRVANLEKATYNPHLSANKLTQGANTLNITSAPTNLSQVSKSSYNLTKAQPTQLGTMPTVQPPRSVWSNAPPSAYVYVNQTYGADVAQRFFNQSYYSPQQIVYKPATLEHGSSFIPNQKQTIRQAGERRNKFVDNNLFQSNPVKHAHSVVPTKVSRRVKLTQGLGVQENPLAILDGDKFVNPSEQYLTQINEIIAPRPEYKVFTNTAYSGVKKTSPMVPTDQKVSNRMNIKAYLSNLKQSDHIGLIAFAGVGLFAFYLFRSN